MSYTNELKHLLMLNIEKLINMGITFSLDDFGTGRSNLDYFVSMPARNIKFDLSFTQGYFTNNKTKHVMKGMVNIVHDMDMRVVSEGVETREQYDYRAHRFGEPCLLLWFQCSHGFVYGLIHSTGTCKFLYIV